MMRWYSVGDDDYMLVCGFIVKGQVGGGIRELPPGLSTSRVLGWSRRLAHGIHDNLFRMGNYEWLIF